MNFTFLSAAMETPKKPTIAPKISEPQVPRFRVEIFENIECLVDDQGKRYAIWSLLGEDVNQSSPEPESQEEE